MLLNTLRIVTFKKHIFYHASTEIFVIYIPFTALHIHHIPIFHGNIYFFPCHQGLIPNFHVICTNIKTSVFYVSSKFFYVMLVLLFT